MRIVDMVPAEEHRPALLYTMPETNFPPTLNLVDWMIDRHVKDGRGDRPALFFHPAGVVLSPGRRQAEGDVTYGELQARVRAVAAGLVRLGTCALQVFEGGGVHRRPAHGRRRKDPVRRAPQA